MWPLVKSREGQFTLHIKHKRAWRPQDCTSVAFSFQSTLDDTKKKLPLLSLILQHLLHTTSLNWCITTNIDFFICCFNISCECVCSLIKHALHFYENDNNVDTSTCNLKLLLKAFAKPLFNTNMFLIKITFFSMFKSFLMPFSKHYSSWASPFYLLFIAFSSLLN